MRGQHPLQTRGVITELVCPACSPNFEHLAGIPGQARAACWMCDGGEKIYVKQDSRPVGDRLTLRSQEVICP